MELGIEHFIKKKQWQGRLEQKRVAFLGHSASVAQNLESSLALILSHTPIKIQCVIGPQHGFNSVQQANMITTEDTPPTHLIELNPILDVCANPRALNTHVGHKCPVFSLYSSKTRRFTPKLLEHFDVLLVDLQDVGCRVYTYITTLFYALEDLSKAGKTVWILDRPNPVGRKVEGSILNKNFLSFVGAGPLPIRHGLTLGELALWYRDLKKLNIELEVIKMQDYSPDQMYRSVSASVSAEHKGFYGGVSGDPTWVLPSPNMVDRECAFCYSGTVLLEGTCLSEARGTVFPLKAVGFPGMQAEKILNLLLKTQLKWLRGCVLRKEFFKPVFDKFKGQVCEGIRIYGPFDHKHFVPYRLVSLLLKCVKTVHSDFNWKSSPPYEYEQEKWPIDILSGDDFLRHWIENPDSSCLDLEKKLKPDEAKWQEQRKPFLLYN